jgi:ABC-type glycerol-3-phosphate transport system permease component
VKFDAAEIDGASDFTVYWRIVLPLSKPILTALTIFTLIQSFNSLIWPLVILSSEQKLTLPLVLARITLVGEQIIFTEMLAAVVLGSVTMILAFLILHRNFIQGIRFTGLGGG